MASTIQVDKIQDTGGNTILSSNGSGTFTSNLPAGVSLTNGVDNRLVTSTSATALNGEARLRYDGDVLWQEASGTTTEFRQTVDGAGTYWSSLIASASDVKLYTRTASPLILGTNNAEKMRVANDGNVGISETNPTARLQVDSGDDNITALKVTQKGGYTGIHLQGDSSNTGTTQMLIDASGTGDQYLKFQSATVTKWQIKDDYSDGHRIWIADDSGDGVYMSQNDTSWSSSSDERLKDNWTNFENAENKINTLTKLGTHKRKIYNKENNTIGETVDGVFNEIKKDINGNDIISVGVSAQEIEAILPEAVTEDANGYKGVNYQSLIPMLLKAVQELSAKVKALENA
jgi:hypothetical protein